MTDKRLHAGLALLAMTTALVPGTTAPAQDAPLPSVGLYGGSGLMDMPTAELQPDQQMSAAYAQFNETTRRNFTVQFLPRVSVTLRYANIDDWGRPNDPDYNLFDRSLDLQFQLLKEKDWQPAVALGFRDFLGTGVYSSEYLVASKTVAKDFTLTAGLGWGRLASGDSNVTNPFCSISDTMCTRDEDFGEGGEVAWNRFFRGEDMGVFGGVEWRTPIEGLRLKAEYSSDGYVREQEGIAASFERNSPVNLGAEYSIRPGITFGGYYMYGSTLGFNVVLSGNPRKPPVPQNLGFGPLPVNPRPMEGRDNTGWANDAGTRAKLIEAVADALSDEGITLEEAKLDGRTAEVFIVNRRISQAPKAIGRTARILAISMPYSVETFRITPVEDGVATTTVTIDRTEYESQISRPAAGQQSWETVGLKGGIPVLSGGNAWRRDVYPLVDWAVIPLPSFQFFGGNEGFRPQLSAEFRGIVRASKGLSFSTRIRQPILGVFDDPGVDPADADDPLPPVRRESARYYAGWDPKLIRLSADYLFKLNPDTYGRVSAGLLERAFAGVGGEVLWKPVDQNWGLGLELNYVWQRDYYSPFGFGHYDYDVVTGHASVYWDTGWYGIETQLAAGRYLAGDWGATLFVSRQFANGWSVGAFATKTDVSAEDFGEGSFDKGILLSIPLRWATPFETRQTIDGDLRSLGSDGGAWLNISNRLYPTVREMDRNRLERNWGSFWQ
jgi:hypothetical protein